jgi:hypothetical protein
MAKVTYKPRSPEDAKSVRMGGKDFEEGKSVDVTNEADLAKFSGNPWFDVSGYEPKKEVAKDRSSGANPADVPMVSIANQSYASQPPGVGAKTAGIVREVGSPEALIETFGEEVAEQKAQETLDALQQRKRGRPPKPKEDHHGKKG